MDLDLRWVEAIHARMLVRYGSAWVSKWQNIPEDAVRADWSSTLANIPPNAIKHALENLPEEFPPTATQFRSLCLAAPRSNEPTRIAGPPADPERVRTIIAKGLQAAAKRHPKQWAHDLLDRAKGAGPGPKPSSCAVAMAREALRTGGDMSNFAGDFVPVDRATLPPGMRTDLGVQR